VGLKDLIPWYVRVVGKVVLSRLPASYAFWRRLHLFSHGSMDRPEYVHAVFRHHFDRAEFVRKSGGWVGLELGPGDSALSALVARAYGARSYVLVDAGHFATGETRPYRQMADFLAERNLETPSFLDTDPVDIILRRCGAQYETRGLDSLRSIPSSSVDFIWSQAALEHVRRHEFLPTMFELRRILRPDGVCSHRVDLKDHLGGGLNNLRISSRWWEREWMVRSGFYTNRLRITELEQLFREAGFAPQIVASTKWGHVPLRRDSLAAEFQRLQDAELLVQDFDVLLKPA
jgi:SAM-dependent methyltransferase